VPFVLPEGLAPEVYPLAWMVGRWRGEGVVGYPGVEESAFTQELEITHDGGPYLAYRTTIRLVVAPDDAAAIDVGASAGTATSSDPDAPPQDVADAGDAPVWTTESGYWRVPPERPADLTPDQHPVELLIADPAGFVAVYVGTTGNGRVDLASDLIAHTATGAAVNAGKRLYGLVDGQLMWAHDMAAFGQPMQSYASGRLSRVDG